MRTAIINVSGTNNLSSTADVSVQVDNPIQGTPEYIYVLNASNAATINASYDSNTNKITVTFGSVAAGATASAELFVQEEHSVWKGGDFYEGTVDGTTNTVSSVESEPDIVLILANGSNVQGMNALSWSYNSTNKQITIGGTINGAINLRAIKLHSIQYKQNGTTDASGVLSGQKEKPDLLIESGKLVAVSKSTIDANYNSENAQISGLSANASYVSIPIHSIFR